MILFQFGSLVFDKYIKYDGYDQTPNVRQDLDSYRDADGVLQRNALKHTATGIEFDTHVMWFEEYKKMISDMTASYINFNERDAMCSYYDFESLKMKTGHFYLDSNWKVHMMWRPKEERFLVGEIHFSFVEY